LSFISGKALTTEQAKLPATAVFHGKSKHTIPRKNAVKNEAILPAREALAVILGDCIDLPTNNAIGSANDRHSTAYHAISKGNK
jgi:hypothetical protein